MPGAGRFIPGGAKNSGGFQRLRHLAQGLNDADVLRAVLLAAATGNAGRRRAAAARQLGIGLGCGVFAFFQPRQLVVKGKVFRNGNVFGAPIAIAARRAGHSDAAADEAPGLQRQGKLALRKGLELLHGADIFLHLFHGAHAAQHHHHIFVRGCKAQPPFGHAHLRPGALQQLAHRLRRVCQRAALQRLHHNHLAAIRLAQLVALARLHGAALPIQVIQLQLHIFHLRVRF